MMQARGLLARILADDVMIIGLDHTGHQRFVQAYEDTLDYFAELGARISPTKCYLFASHAGTRSWLANHVWASLAIAVKVVLHARDLGAHLNTCATNAAPTFTHASSC